MEWFMLVLLMFSLVIACVIFIFSFCVKCVIYTLVNDRFLNI